MRLFRDKNKKNEPRMIGMDEDIGSLIRKGEKIKKERELEARNFDNSISNSAIIGVVIPIMDFKDIVEENIKIYNEEAFDNVINHIKDGILRNSKQQGVNYYCIITNNINSIDCVENICISDYYSDNKEKLEEELLKDDIYLSRYVENGSEYLKFECK